MIKESLIRSSELRLLLASILCLTVNLPAISNSPDSQTTMNRRTNLLIARHKKAESSDTTGSEEVDEVGKLIEQADLASDSDDREKAIVIYEKALSLTDSNNSTNCNLSTLLRKLGLAYSLSKRFGIAIKTLERAIAESEKEQSQEAVTDLVASHYALARTYEADISLDNAHQKALSECQSALDLATSQLADNRRLIARVKALKAELVFSHIEDKLDKPSDKQPIESDFSLHKPLIGQVSALNKEEGSAKPKQSLISEIPSLDPLGAETPLQADTNQTLLLNGSKKNRQTLAQKVTEFGTMGLCLYAPIGTPWMASHVLDGGAAQAAGIRKWDMLFAVDGHPTTGVDIKQVYYMLTGRRGEIRNLEIQRGQRKLTIQVPLRNVYEMQNTVSEHIEYYWFLLYHDYITGAEYAQLSKPYEKHLH